MIHRPDERPVRHRDRNARWVSFVSAARKACEAAGAKLHGFYGMFGQEYGLMMILEAPGHAEYLGGVLPAILSGTFESYTTVPLYTGADVSKALPIARKVRDVYKAPGG